MQAYLAWLDQSVAARIAQGDADAPVFVRLFLQLTADHGLLEPLLASALRLSATWTGAAVTRVQAHGDAKLGYLGALAAFAGGQSALITVEAAAEYSASLLVIARHGSIKLDDFPEPWQIAPGPPDPRPAEASLIRQSLVSHRAAEAAR